MLIDRPMPVPGPRGHVFLGVLPELRGNPLQVFTAAARDYGDFVRLPVGPWRVYLLNHPDHVKRVLQDNHRNYRLTRFYAKLRPIFGNGLFASEGAHWRHQRHVIQPAFYGEQVEALVPVMTAVAARMIERLRVRASGAVPFDIAQEMARLTLEMVARSMFATDLGDKAEDASRAIGVLLETAVGRTTDLTGLGEHLPTRRNRRFRQALRVMEDIVHGILERRRREGAERRDLLSRLLEDRERDAGANEVQLRDEVMTMLVSGNVATANALTWTWYSLARYPAVETRVRDEVATVLAGRTPAASDLPNLGYTRMVLEETLRLFPPVWRLARTAVDADEIGGHAVPAGATVVISPYLLHRHPDFWDQPEAFRPERFAPEKSIGRPRYAYIPFGGGPRVCVGRPFAMMEIQLVVAMVTQAFRLHLVPEHPVEPEAVVSLRPRHGLLMTVEEPSIPDKASPVPFQRLM